jgi:orotate phosphoribosyltransferase
VTNPPSAVLALFEETGAYLRGHFRLTSGLHSGEYLQCARVLRFPTYAERFGRDLAARLVALVRATPDLVVSPAMGGLIIGHEVARALGTPFLFTERDSSSGKMSLRRGFTIDPGQTAVIIEDVITTGGSTREVVDLIRTAGGHVLAAGSIIDRSGGQADVGVPRIALETLHPVNWQPGECPLCAQGIEIQKPGSRVVPAAR